MGSIDGYVFTTYIYILIMKTMIYIPCHLPKAEREKHMIYIDCLEHPVHNNMKIH